ncbi:MAG: efflux RND transporter permease subunit [Cyclobacteriaceae bacterium]
MWTSLAHIVIKFRLTLIILLALVTAFMAYHAKDVELSYDFSKVVPANDPAMVEFKKFREIFGEDGNIIAVGLKDSSIFKEDKFRRLKYLCEEFSRIKGVEGVISLPTLQRLTKNKQGSIKKFELEPIFTYIPEKQILLDSMLNVAMEQKFYHNQIINSENGALLILLTVDKDLINSPARLQLIDDLQQVGKAFELYTEVELHYAGLPFVRAIVSEKVKKEMRMFLILSVLVTAAIMLFFFRSWDAVLFPMIIIAVVVIWSMGTLALFDYKITLLSGLIPPIIVVIGIPNSIYLLNKYHQEINKHGNKMKALSRVIRKVGLVTLLTNATTAIGFLVLTTTEITILKQFGIVAGINILATFFVSIILIPAVFSYLPAPHGQQLRHLKFKAVDRSLHFLDLLVHRKKYSVFVVTGIILFISVFGLMRMHSISYMVDDIPKNSPIKRDLAFFEDNFSGIMPMEVIIDTGKPNGIIRQNTLNKIAEFEMYIDSLDYISPPLSIVSFIKASRQAFYNNNPAYYDLPNNYDKNFIMQYFKGNSNQSGLLQSFVDSTGQQVRISLNVADIGSAKMDSLINQIEPKAKEIFSESGMEATVTGTSPIFVKGNKFLVENLRVSLLFAFVFIALIMAFLYGNLRRIIISIIPNVIPLMLVGAIMGFANIPLKPSTVLIFSIAFGISVDYAIHFLAKYKQELKANQYFVPLAVSKSIKETGLSMVYTSIVLFMGFIIFAGSEFGGTKSLGLLTATTLLLSLFTNLIVLPSLLLAFDSGNRKKDFPAVLEHFDEFYHEDEDEEIDTDKIEIKAQRREEDFESYQQEFN